MKAFKLLLLAIGLTVLTWNPEPVKADVEELLVWIVRYNPQRIECKSLLPSALTPKENDKLLRKGHIQDYACDGSPAVVYLDLQYLLGRLGTEVPVIDCNGNPVF